MNDCFYAFQLEKNQAELQRKLREAEDTRFTREGEISILRASIAKVWTQLLYASSSFTTVSSG